jgi:hypothetical protein
MEGGKFVTKTSNKKMTRRIIKLPYENSNLKMMANNKGDDE